MAIYEKITEHAVDQLLDAGFEIEVFDGEETALKYSSDAKAIKAELFHTDDVLLYVRTPSDKIYVGFVQFYFENGAECLHDYSVVLESVLAATNKFAEDHS